MAELQPTDKILVNRNGVDYQTEAESVISNDGKLTINNSDGTTAGQFTANQAGDTTITLPEGFSGSYNDLTDKPVIGGPVDIKLWNPPTARDLEWETVASFYGTGVSACRGDGLGEHKITGRPQHVQLKDGSHNYIVPAICGGGNPYGESVYLLLLDNELNITKRIEVPSSSKLSPEGFITSFPNSNPLPEESQPADYYSNILVWNDIEGIWTSTDYGDTWIKYENKHGGTENYTSENTRLIYNLDGQQFWRYHLFFNKISAAEFVFDGIKLTQYASSLYGVQYGLDPNNLWTADLPLSPDFDEYSWKECSMDTGVLELLSEHHAWADQYFIHAEQHPWLEFRNSQNAGNWLLCVDPAGKSWNIADGWDKFPRMTVIKYQKEKLEKFQETVFKKHFQDTPQEYISSDANYYPGDWCIAWDSGTEAFFCQYQDGRDGFFNMEHSIYWLPDHILATRDMQTGWVPYRAKSAHPVDESVKLQRKTARKEVEVESSVDERTGGSHFETDETASLHRFPGSSTGLFLVNGSVTTSTLMLDAPVNGVSEHWGENYPWLISLKDGRLWQADQVTKEPFYSLKKGILINGHFIERPAYEVGSPLAGEVGGSV